MAVGKIGGLEIASGPGSTLTVSAPDTYDVPSAINTFTAAQIEVDNPPWYNSDAVDCYSTFLSSKTLDITVNNVLQQYDDSGGGKAQVNNNDVTSGEYRSGLIACSDVTKYYRVTFYSDAGVAGSIGCDGDYMVWGTASTNNLCPIVDNHWYYWHIHFTSTTTLDIEIYDLATGELLYSGSQAVYNTITNWSIQVWWTDNTDFTYYGYSAAAYYGDDEGKSWMNFAPGMVSCKGLVLNGSPVFDYRKYFAIGAENATYMPLIPRSIASITATTKIEMISLYNSPLGILGTTTTGGQFKIFWDIPLDKKLGVLDLYLKGFRIEIYDGDATNRFKVFYIYEIAGATVNLVGSYTGDIYAIGTNTRDFTSGPFNVGAKKSIHISSLPYQVSSRTLEFSVLEVEYYYA